MIKYLIGLGALAVVVIGYFLLVPVGNAPAPAPDLAVPAPEPAPDPAPSAIAPVAPDAVVSNDVAPASADEETLLEDMAADVRASLPSKVTDTLTLADVLFLPRMQIME